MSDPEAKKAPDFSGAFFRLAGTSLEGVPQ